MRQLMTMFSLVLAGEAIYGLPFHITRYFRPTFVEVFEVTQTQLGILGSLYGVVATFSYLLGGGLADRFSPRSLLAGSLIATGASGFYLLNIPTFAGLLCLYGFWGVTTILPFWAALISATRDWGGTEQQGRAFGLLDGGRGLLAAVLAMLAVALFAQFLPVVGGGASLGEKRLALQVTILVYTSSCFIAALMVWLCLPKWTAGQARGHRPNDHSADGGTQATAVVSGAAGSWAPTRAILGNLYQVLTMRAIWLQAIVIVGAYSVFKGIDFYSQYASDIWGWSAVGAAGLSAYSSWMRPVASVLAGFSADRWSASAIVMLAFVLAAVTSVVLAVLPPLATLTWMLWGAILVGCLGIFALRGIYFALLEEARIPMHLTGTAVGVVSFIGYTPEIFIPLLGGFLIDSWQGRSGGYQILFGGLAVAAIVGIAATLGLRWLGRHAAEPVRTT